MASCDRANVKNVNLVLFSRTVDYVKDIAMLRANEAFIQSWKRYVDTPGEITLDGI